MTRLIRPFPRVNDPKDIEKWYNELRHAVLGMATNTDSLPEGSTNLYFTNERVDDRAAALIQAGNVITWVYNDALGTLTPTIGVDTAAGLGVSGGKIVVVLAANKGITFDANGDLQIKDGDGIKVGSAGVEADLASNKGLEISSGAIAVKDGDGIKVGAAGVEVDYNSTNLKITSNALNTVQDIATTSSPTFVTVTATTSVVAGSGGNTTTIANDGIYLQGDATQFRDELGDITQLVTVGPGVSLNTTEVAVEFVATANLNDFVVTNVQRNHDALAQGKIYPHIHCWLNQEAVVPNMLLRYRWQENGGAKVTSWSDYKINTLVYGQPAAGVTGNAILGNTTGITPPANSFVSPIIQFKLFRDSANASTVFAGADPYTGTFSVTSFDIHVELDTMGSRQQYVK